MVGKGAPTMCPWTLKQTTRMASVVAEHRRRFNPVNHSFSATLQYLFIHLHYRRDTY